MEKESVYVVTSPTGGVREYFNSRESAIAFIVDEFATALAFRVGNESDKLAEYLGTHDETPDRYPYKYVIQGVRLNTDYDVPRRVYAVHDNLVVDGACSEMTCLFRTYGKAKGFFDGIVGKDAEEHGSVPTTRTEREGKEGEYAMYERWDENQPFCLEHYTVTIATYEEDASDKDVLKFKTGG